MRRYKLERSANGRITQCDNADGGNIYAQREEINKKAIENLQRPTPGKLGNLANFQFFNFKIADIDTPTGQFIAKKYNTTSTFPANATQTIMFGVAGSSNKALYYNIVYLNAVFTSNGVTATVDLIQPSYIRFYLLQNSSGTSSLGTKIPQPAPLSGNGGGAVTFTTDGNNFGTQSITCDLKNDTGLFAQNNNTKGIRASGLALSEIVLHLSGSTSLSAVEIDVTVGVDTSSVSTTY
jgi:hypothetical protein